MKFTPTQNRFLDKPLFDLLPHDDIITINQQTNIRNCKIRDLTLEELLEITLILKKDIFTLVFRLS